MKTENYFLPKAELAGEIENTDPLKNLLSFLCFTSKINKVCLSFFL